MRDARILAWILADPARSAQLKPHQWTATLTIACVICAVVACRSVVPQMMLVLVVVPSPQMML